QRLAVLGADDVVDVIVVDCLIGNEDVGQERRQRFGAGVGDVGADVDANAGDAMTRGTILLEDFLAALAVALQRQRGLIFLQDFLAVGGQIIGEQLVGK